jgi:protein CpxP
MKMLVAVLVSTFVFGGVVAQTPDQSSSRHSSAGPTIPNSDAKRDGEVEKPQWNKVAETMRENATELDRAIDKRDASVANATAIDNLSSYGDIVQAHANGIKKLASAFSGLYSAMSDDQKKVADEVFSHRGHEGNKVARQ